MSKNKKEVAKPTYEELEKKVETMQGFARANKTLAETINALQEENATLKKSNASLRGLNKSQGEKLKEYEGKYLKLKRDFNEKNELVDAVNAEVNKLHKEIDELKKKATASWWKRIFS